MDVVLRNKVDGLGQRGDIVDVAEGYARNFLFPKGHAIKASGGSIEQAAKMRTARDQKDQSAREAATSIASTLVPKMITVSAKASAEGKLFGSITAVDVVDAIKEQTDIDLDRKADRRRSHQDDRSAHGDGVVASRRVVPDHARRRRRRVALPTVTPRQSLPDNHSRSSLSSATPGGCRSATIGPLPVCDAARLELSTATSTGRCPQREKVVHSESTGKSQGCSPYAPTAIPWKSGVLMAGDGQFGQFGGGGSSPIEWQWRTRSSPQSASRGVGARCTAAVA